MSLKFGAGDPTPKEEIDARIAGLKMLMAESGIDFCVILQHVDLFYFTGSIQKATLVVTLDGEPPLYFVQRSVERAREETSLPIIEAKGDSQIWRMLKEKGVLRGRGGMEFDVVPVGVFQRFVKGAGFDNFTDISGLIKGLRVVKSPFELEQIRKSGAICEAVFVHAPEVIREGVREVDIDAALIAVGRRQGHQGLLRMRGLNQEMMSIYVTSGYSGTIASAGDVPVAGIGVTPAIAQGSSMKTVQRGIPVLVDYGGGYNGYITDETRSYVVGDLEETFRRPYDVAREIVEDTEVFGKEGVDCTDLFLRAADKVKRAGLGAHFMGFGADQVSFIGHGLGLEINELPVITARHKMVLKEGMAFAFEPKFIFPGKGVVGIEVDFIVRKDKLERVTKTPVDLVQL
jgi:Xaa-Pro aminopeptidase